MDVSQIALDRDENGRGNILAANCFDGYTGANQQEELSEQFKKVVLQIAYGLDVVWRWEKALVLRAQESVNLGQCAAEPLNLAVAA